MKIIIAGASGFVGSALTPALRAWGHNVFRLVRGRGERAADEIAWDPAAGRIDLAGVKGVDAVINLAGENLAAGRWTEARRERILRSRVDATRTLVTAMAALERKPEVFISASGINFYGERGDELLTETQGVGQGFLPEVCLAWETHAEGASRVGVRTIMLRFGMILSREGGALAKMLPLFRLGLGGRLGSGRQWTSWVALADVVGVVGHVLRDVRCAGPMNVVAPHAVTNREFAASLGRALRRPAMLPAPAWALRLAFGRRMADEVLLASVRAAPGRLREAGYSFQHQELEPALNGILRQ